MIWLKFIIKIFIFSFLWDRILDFSLHHFKYSKMNFFWYGFAALLIGTATATTIISHPDVHSWIYFIIGLFFAQPFAAFHIEDESKSIRIAMLINIVIYCITYFSTLYYPTWIPKGMQKIVGWLSV